MIFCLVARVSSETSFVSKQPKLEPKLVLALSETRHLFGCFAVISKQGVSVFQNNRNKQKTNQNSSKFVKISTFLIPHTISSVCFSCFDTGPKHRNKPKNNRNRLSFGLFRFKPRKKTNCFEDPLIENVYWKFFRFVSVCFGLFRFVPVCFDKVLFVSTKFCLFRLL
jgi:hypothetical protein